MLRNERKFPDSNPEIPYAGKLTHNGITVEDCLNIIEPIPSDTVRKFQNTTKFPVGAKNNLPYSPDPKSALLQARHGIKIPPTDTVASCLFPPRKTYFSERKTEIIDENLGSKNRKRKFPLGRLPAYECPIYVDPLNTTFGNPLRRTEPMELAANLHLPEGECKRMYQLNEPTHSRSEGEIGTVSANRNYNENFNPDARFGTEPCPPTEDSLYRVFRKSDPNLKDYIVPTSLQDYYDKVHPKLGRCTQIETKNLDPEIRFGIVTQKNSSAEEGMNILLYVKSRIQEILKNIYQRLKDANFNRFDQLLALCKYFDKSNNGWISYLDLKSACEMVGLPLSTRELNDFLYTCTDLRSAMNTYHYTDFVNLLNYKTPFPAEFEQPPDMKISEQVTKEVSQALQNLEESPKADLTEKLFMSTEEMSHEYVPQPLPPRLVKPGEVENHMEGVKPGEFRRKPFLQTVEGVVINKKPCNQYSSNCPPNEEIKCAEIMHHLDTSLPISTDIGAMISEVNTDDWVKFGNSSILSNHPAPRIQRLSDLTNYGDGFDAYSLLSPSIYTHKGVDKTDLLKPRSKKEIFDIFTNIGVQLDQDAFERIWNIAASFCGDNNVNVESFRHVLDKEMTTRMFG